MGCPSFTRARWTPSHGNPGITHPTMEKLVLTRNSSNNKTKNQNKTKNKSNVPINTNYSKNNNNNSSVK